MLNSFICSLMMMLMVLLSVAFFTLFERKVLGYIQIRKGPNKVSFMGLFQPFSDAIKLFTKEFFILLKSNYMYYLISPMMMMTIMLLIWQNIPMMTMIFNNLFSLLMIMCILSLGVFPLVIGGWASNSIYSLIGGMRSVAQTISYEVSMILIMLSVVFLIEGFNMYMFYNYQIYLWFIFMNFPMALILFISFLAEMNRTPFDLAEGESELVSGFNTEYMSGGFALIFIAEYGMIIFMMMIFSHMFLGGNIFNLLFYLLLVLELFMVLWIRGTVPRIRYDKLMDLTWMSFLPISLNYLIFITMIKFIG